MIQMETRLKCADNTGAKVLKCIKVLGGAGRRFANIGDIIRVSVCETTPKSKVKAGTVQHAVIVRSKKGVQRPDGSVIRFSENSAVLLKQGEPMGTRIFCAVPREIRQVSIKIVSLAPEVY